MDATFPVISLGAPDLREMLRMVVPLLIAAGCGAVIGFQREQLGKPAGLRTHMLVSIGAAMVIGAGVAVGMDDDALSRIIQGLVTGIGFLGAGAILKRETEGGITGLTTAAGIWVTAAIGVVAGLGRFNMALTATALTWAVLALVGRIERRAQNGHLRRSRL